MTHPIPATTISSPVEYTLGVLEDRLDFAEEETQKLTKQLTEYGFQRLPAEKPDENSTIESECKQFKALVGSINDGKYHNVVSRLCQTESIIKTMKDGIQSIEDERSITKAQLLKEKSNIQECYTKELALLKAELQNSKLELSSFATIKTSLEKQIEKLKKELTKRIETQRNLLSKIREKDTELNVFQEKLTQLTKDSGKQQSSQKKLEEAHSSLILNITKLEEIVEIEKNKVSQLNEKCDSLTKDALLAREEFEREFNNRLQLENLLTVQEEDFELSNKKIEELLSENKIFKEQNDEQKERLKIISDEKGALSDALDTATSENKKLKECLKKAITDKNALIDKGKESLTRENLRVESILTQQNKVLNSTKDTFIAELEKQRKQTEEMQNQNLKLSTELHETKVKIGECEFKSKLMQQNYESELKQLYTTLQSETNMKEEALEKIHLLEDCINERNLEVKYTTEQCETLRRDLAYKSDSCTKLEVQCVEISEKLSWMTVSKESNEQMKLKMTEMINEKNSLSYEKGVLETKISKLEEELYALRRMKDDYDGVMSRCSELEKQLQQAAIESKEMLEELRKKDTQIKSTNSELKLIKENIPQEKNRFEHLENRNKELTSEIEKLHKDLEEVVQRYEDEIKLLKNRVVSNTKEQQNASDHFKGLMSTNDQLQKQLQNLQESLGRKDFQIQNFTAERHKNVETIEEMKTELKNLNMKIDQMEEDNKNNIEVMHKKLKTLEEQNSNLKHANSELKNENKSAKSRLAKSELKIKEKDEEIKKWMKSKDQASKSVKEKHEKDIENLKKSNRKGIEKLKGEMQALKELHKEKENNFQEKLLEMNIINKKVEELNREKKTYMEKNTKQGEILEAFMQQVSDLQGELSTIIEEQSITSSLLKEKDDYIKDEKRKRKEVEQKFKVMLRKKAVDDFQVSKKSWAISQPDSKDFVDQNLMEERLQTQYAVKKYQRTMEKEEKKMRKLEDDIIQIHRMPKKNFVNYSNKDMI